MENLSRGDLAEKYFRDGYNCSQAVILAFADLIDGDVSLLLKVGSSFGGGMGRLREVCGAFSGAITVLGCLEGYDTPETGEIKADHYKRIQEFAGIFSEANGGSIVCRELLGLKDKNQSPVPSPRTEEFYKKRPCVTIIRNAADLLDQFLKDK